MTNAQRRCFAVLVLPFLTGIIAVAQAFAPGEITGLILAPDGRPVGSALVSAAIASQMPPRQDSPPVKFVLSTHTAKDGTFTIPTVPVGDGRVCADSPDPTALLLNNCRWADGPLANITAGSPRAVIAAIKLTQ